MMDELLRKLAAISKKLRGVTQAEVDHAMAGGSVAWLEPSDCSTSSKTVTFTWRVTWPTN